MWGLKLNDSQHAIISDSDNTVCKWASDLHEVNMVVDGKQRQWLSGHETGKAKDWRDAHTLCEIRFCPQHAGNPQLQFKCAVFEMAQGNGRVFINIPDMYDLLDLQLCPGTGCSWFGHYEERWKAIALKLGFDGTAVRKAVPPSIVPKICKKRKLRDDDALRVLDFHSINLGLCMVKCLNTRICNRFTI